MATYYIDSGSASPGSPWGTWATAAHSMKDIYDGGIGTSGTPFAAGDVIYVASDSVDTASYADHFSIYAPSSSAGLPVHIYSTSDQSNEPPTTYNVATTNQFDTKQAGAYDYLFYGNWRLHGIRVDAGRNITCRAGRYWYIEVEDCYLKPALGWSVYNWNVNNSQSVLRNCTIDGGNSISNDTAAIVSAWLYMTGCSFVNMTYRTGSILSLNTSGYVSGNDFTNCTNCAYIAPYLNYNASWVIANNILPSGKGVFNAEGGSWPYPDTFAMATGNGTGDSTDEAQLWYVDWCGSTKTSLTVLRTGGAAVEGINHSWRIYTCANSNLWNQHRTPWQYGVLSSTGSKTFTAYIANNTRDYDTEEVVLEVEVKAGSGDDWTLVSSRTNWPTAATDHDTDGVSEWTGATLNYPQKLSVTTTVGNTGQFRWRLCVGYQSLDTANEYIYLDPKIVVT